MSKKLKPYGWAVILITISYGVGQLYEFWDYPNSVVGKYFPFIEKEMPFSWYIKFLSEEMNRILEAGVAIIGLNSLRPLLINPKHEVVKVLVVVSRVYMAYRILDLIWFVTCFKQINYWMIFIILFIVETILYKKSKVSHGLWIK